MGLRAKTVLFTVLCFGVLGFAQTATPAVIGVDGLFHVQSALQVRENLPLPWMAGFRWLELTAMRHDRFADFYWGFHLLLLPFTFLARDPEVVAKIAPVVLTAVSLSVLLVVLGRASVRRPFLWSWLALVSSPIFVMRMSQAKAPTAMLGHLLAVTWALMEGRPLFLGLACLAAVWTYPILLPCWEASCWQDSGRARRSSGACPGDSRRPPLRERSWACSRIPTFPATCNSSS